MKLDSTIGKILQQIQVEVAEKYQVDLSIEHLFDIVKVQFDATRLGFTKNLSVHWARFGKFVFTNRHTRKTEINDYKRVLETDHSHLPIEEQERLVKEFIISKAEEKQKYIGKATNVTAKPFKSKEVNELPKGNSHKPEFIIINYKHK